MKLKHIDTKKDKKTKTNDKTKANEARRFKLHLADKIDLKNPSKKIALVNLSIYYTWKNIKNV